MVAEALIHESYLLICGCSGEAAGIAIGLVKLGTCDLAAITDMLTYARESQHEKILRGLAVGLALTLYGRLEEADHCIGELARDKDPILRWAAALSIAAAYAGTANNAAVRQLLHMAVSDVADDVRRAAVASIGFILFRSPEQCPTVVSLLAESYNPHVRFTAALFLFYNSYFRPITVCHRSSSHVVCTCGAILTKDTVAFMYLCVVLCRDQMVRNNHIGISYWAISRHCLHDTKQWLCGRRTCAVYVLSCSHITTV